MKNIFISTKISVQIGEYDEKKPRRRLIPASREGLWG